MACVARLQVAQEEAKGKVKSVVKVIGIAQIVVSWSLPARTNALLAGSQSHEVGVEDVVAAMMIATVAETVMTMMIGIAAVIAVMTMMIATVVEAEGAATHASEDPVTAVTKLSRSVAEHSPEGHYPPEFRINVESQFCDRGLVENVTVAIIGWVCVCVSVC